MMSLPRRLSLRRRGDGLVLVQRPVIRDGAPLFEARDIAVDGRHEFPTTAMAVRIVAISPSPRRRDTPSRRR